MNRLILSTMLALSAATFGGAFAASTLTPAGTVISNIGVFDYIDDNNAPQTVSSSAVSLTVSQVASLNIAPDGTTTTPGQTVYAAPGTSGMLTYTVQNTGNGNDNALISTLDGGGAPLSGVTYYYDMAKTQPVVSNSVPLSAGQTKTVYAFYTLPTISAGGTGTLIDPVGTSTFDSSKVDSNNYGVIVTQNVHQVTVSTNNALSATSPGSVSGAHTLSNTGNTPITSATAGSISLSGTVTDASSVLSSVQYVFSDGTSTGAVSSSVSTAFANYLSVAGPLAAGSSVSYAVTYATAAGKTAGLRANNVTAAYFSQANTASDSYATRSSTATTASDQVTIIAGNAVVTKTGDNCGTDATCAAPVLNTTTGKPGDYLRYTITVKNAGTSALKGPLLHDTLNAYLTFVKVTAITSQTGAGVNLVYSTDGATFTSAAPTTLGASNTVYVGQDTAGNTGKPTSTDTLNVNETITVTVLTRIQ